MATYCNEISGKPINWNFFLNNCIHRPDRVSQEDIKEYIGYSKRWTTCAVGNQCSVIPRRLPHGYPCDSILTDLGFQFNDLVELNLWNEAKEVLKKIEARSAQLIAEINAKK